MGRSVDIFWIAKSFIGHPNTCGKWNAIFGDQITSHENFLSTSPPICSLSDDVSAKPRVGQQLDVQSDRPSDGQFGGQVILSVHKIIWTRTAEPQYVGLLA